MSDIDNQNNEAPVISGGGQSLSGVTMLELRIFHCRYIVSEAKGLFCGDTVHRVSYCKTHYSLCYVKPKRPPPVPASEPR